MSNKNLEFTLGELAKVGLSEPEEEVPFITDEPKIPSFICFPNCVAKSKFYTEKTYGQGFSPRAAMARVKAVAEFLERLCLYNPDSAFFRVDRFQNSDKFADPSLFYCYSKEQFLDREEKIKRRREGVYRWIEVLDFRLKKKIFIPSQLVYLSPIFQDELAIRKEQISTGAALGSFGTDMAFNSGLLEVIERDSCISHYLKKTRLAEVTDLPKDLDDLKNYLDRYALQPYIFDVATDLAVPSIMVVTLDYSGIGNAVNVGSKSAFNYKEAILGALLESIQCRRSSRIFGNLMFGQRIPSESELISLEDRFLHWSPKEKIRDIQYLVADAPKVSYRELTTRNTDSSKVVETLFSRGYHLFVADITLPDIRERGFEVLKVVIPELHPLYLDERAKSLYSIHHGEIKDDPTLKPHPIT